MSRAKSASAYGRQIVEEASYPAWPRPAVPMLSFLGAAGTVTGSRFLIDTPDARVLVDCGLFQGLKELRLRNWAPFPLDPASIDAVVVTHAHIDHIGYLPRLCREGFRGRVVCTDSTARLAAIVLPDSGHLQEEEAEYANRMGFSKHHPALPLYTEADAVRALDQIDAHPFNEWVELARGVEVQLRPSGHILGSATATVRLTESGRTVLFSGDLGRANHPLLVPPAPPDGAARKDLPNHRVLRRATRLFCTTRHLSQEFVPVRRDRRRRFHLREAARPRYARSRPHRSHRALARVPRRAGRSSRARRAGSGEP